MRDYPKVEDGMGFAGLVSTAAEKREEAERERVSKRFQDLQAANFSLHERNRELTERLEAAERLVEKWRNVETTNRTSQIVYGWAAEELEQAIAPAAPVKPVAGEERTT